MSQLKVAQQKFGDSKENVKKLMKKDSGGMFHILMFRKTYLRDYLILCGLFLTGKDILVPLTSAVSFQSSLKISTVYVCIFKKA